MRNVKMLFLVVSMLSSFSVIAQNTTPTTSPVETVKAITGEKKKESRKKKATMCEECGKPETECECEHEEEGKKHK